MHEFKFNCIMNKKGYIVLLTFFLIGGYLLSQLTSCVYAELNSTKEKPWITLSEVRTASDRVLVAFFTCDTFDIKAIDISNPADWKINRKTAEAVHLYAMQTDGINFHVYLETGKLVKGKKYKIETPYGSKSIKFNEENVFCESIKTNQVGYSALSTSNYANFAI